MSGINKHNSHTELLGMQKVQLLGQVFGSFLWSKHTFTRWPNNTAHNNIDESQEHYIREWRDYTLSLSLPLSLIYEILERAEL